MIAALNGLDILAADIGNAYPNAPCYGKVYFTAGAEFGNRKYAHEIVVHAMYGLKYNGDAQISHWTETTRNMDFVPSEDNPNVWMQKATKSNGFKYLEYLLIYVDAMLWISEHPEKFMDTIKSVYLLKEDTTGKAYGTP